MKPRWHRVSGTIYDQGDQRAETVSVFYDYNLLNWFFGFPLDCDESWYDLHIGVGPIGVSFVFWRRYVAVLHPGD